MHTRVKALTVRVLFTPRTKRRLSAEVPLCSVNVDRSTAVLKPLLCYHCRVTQSRVFFGASPNRGDPEQSPTPVRGTLMLLQTYNNLCERSPDQTPTTSSTEVCLLVGEVLSTSPKICRGKPVRAASRHLSLGAGNPTDLPAFPAPAKHLCYSRQVCPYPPPYQGARHPGASQGSVSVGRGQTSFAQERGSPQPSCVHAVPRGSIARSLATAPLRSTLVPLGWPPRNTTIPPARIPPDKIASPRHPTSAVPNPTIDLELELGLHFGQKAGQKAIQQASKPASNPASQPASESTVLDFRRIVNVKLNDKVGRPGSNFS